LPRNSTGTATTAEASPSRDQPARREAAPYRGRFAPSPTGPLHFGSLLAAAGSWLDARAAGGEWLLRIEDLDPPREPPGAAAEILHTLEAFGLVWDGPVTFQSRRLAYYEAALEALSGAGWAYPCTCSRKQIELANQRLGRASARVYPGTCRSRTDGPARRTRIVRVQTPSESIGIQDRLQGAFSQQLQQEVGDFVLRRREGYIAYQLAVVVDDCLQGVTDVVRGTDLLDSTPRQVWLQRLLGYPSPRYLHLPVVALRDGRKLSKQTGAAAVGCRHAGESAWRVLACLRQAPPDELRGAPPAEVWAWGVRHWQPHQLAGVRSIPAP
jgi:glutamyl-Q tRNA(Asp) synthetase